MPHQVDPEVAQLCGVTAGEPSHQRDGDIAAMPTAAETKFWTVKPAICTRWPWVDSPSRPACQLVLVTKLIAVFHASAGVIGVAGSLRCSGSPACTSWRTKRNRMLTAEKASTLRA